MRNPVLSLLFLTFLFLTLTLLPPLEVSAQPLAQVIYTPTPMEVQTAEQLIEAVNAFRLANGLPSLSVHPVLMQVAQWEVNALVNGAVGHTRPNGLTLGQWLLSLGYPLSGDLSLDGYRSENIALAPGLTVQGVIHGWSLDDPHTNTMLSPNRSDIGAAVASAQDEWGFTVYYYFLETALQTNSGKMQYNAYSILTGIPQTQVAYVDEATQWAENTGLSHYSAPVFVSTPLPDGSVFHEVKYGQTLWSIAITYHTSIKQIQQLNNLSSTTITVGQKLLVLKDVTQVAPTANQIGITSTATPLAFMTPPKVEKTLLPTEQAVEEYSERDGRNNTLGVAGIIIATIFLGAVFSMMARMKARICKTHHAIMTGI